LVKFRETAWSDNVRSAKLVLNTESESKDSKKDAHKPDSKKDVVSPQKKIKKPLPKKKPAIKKSSKK